MRFNGNVGQMTVATAELPPPVKSTKFTSNTGRLYAERHHIRRKTKSELAAFTADLTAKTEKSLPVVSGNVRANLALSLLRQSSLLATKPVKSYEAIVGGKGRIGLMDALSSLADSAAKVFQWSQEQNTQLISIGSFVQVNQAPASVPNLSPNQAVIDITQQTDASVVGSEPMTGSVPVPEQ